MDGPISPGARRKQLFWRLDSRQRRLFELQAAESILPHFEARFPDDVRPRQALAVARSFLEDRASKDDLAAAHRAAYDASQQARALDEKLADYAAYAASAATLFYHPNAASSDFVPSAADAALNVAYAVAADREPDAPVEQRADDGDAARRILVEAQLAALEALLAPGPRG